MTQMCAQFVHEASQARRGRGPLRDRNPDLGETRSDVSLLLQDAVTVPWAKLEQIRQNRGLLLVHLRPDLSVELFPRYDDRSVIARSDGREQAPLEGPESITVRDEALTGCRQSQRSF
jgi:hypothetical protein